MNKEESKISNTEWGLVIGALLMIDLIQMVLEWLIIGLFINWIIDMFVGMSFALYLQLRGQSLANPKRLFGLIGTFFAELIPVVDELPLWCLDGIFNMVISKSDKILGQIPGGNLAANAVGGNKQTFIDVSRGVQEARNLEASRNRNKYIDVSKGAQEKRNLEAGMTRNRPIDISRGVQEARNLERSRNRMVDVNAQKNPEKMNGQRIPQANQSSAPSDNKNNGKTDSMSIHDELWELNAKPDLSKEDKERLQKAYWIMEHNQIEDKEKDDPVLLRAFERASRGEVIFDGSPEKRHGFKFSNVQIVNATNKIAGRDFASLNPQYGDKEKK